MAGYLELGAQRSESFSHDRKPHASGARPSGGLGFARIESPAVVPNFETDLALQFFRRDRHLGRARVLDDVREYLLYDAVNDNARVGRQQMTDFVKVTGDAQVAGASGFVDEAPQGEGDPQGVQALRAEVL